VIRTNVKVLSKVRIFPVFWILYFAPSKTVHNTVVLLSHSFHVVLATQETYIAGPSYLCPADIRPSVPSAILSQITQHCSRFTAIGHDFASTLEIDDNRSGSNRGCMREVPEFIQLLSYVKCKRIF
jgi:hypothetical protein